MNTPESNSENSPTPAAACGHDHPDGSACSGHDHAHSHAHDSEGNNAEKKFFFSLEAIAMALWGVVLVYYVASGKVNPFLSTTGIFREQALIGGVALLVLALFNLAMRNRFPGCGHDHSEDGGGEHHHHEEGSWLSRLITLFLLVAPVSMAAAYAPSDWTQNYKLAQANSMVATNAPAAGNAMAAQMSKGSGTSSTSREFTLEDFKKYCPPNKDGNFPMSVSDIWSAAGDPDARRVMTGQIAEVTGQIVPDNLSKEGRRLRLYELQMTCCAADSRPVSFPIEFESAIPEYRESGWYRVIAKIEFSTERTGKCTLLKVIEMKPSVKPRQDGGPTL
jgi:hypothetical protein